jgi:nucleoside-diphosphate-sugar epimerase
MNDNTQMNNIEDEAALEQLLSQPSDASIAAMSKMEGDLILLGAGGKMGPTLAMLARRSLDAAGSDAKVIAVSRYTNPAQKEKLEREGISTIASDLLDRDAINALPDVANVMFMAGRKFGSTGGEALTWAFNTVMPIYVAEKYCNSRIVVFSSGNVYPFSPIESGGSSETTPTGPVGEYAQSVLGRERVFEYFSQLHGTKISILRINYAVEPRYGVLLDIAIKVRDGQPIDLTMGYANAIWQRDANEWSLRCLEHCAAPPRVINITGEETLSIRQLAQRFGQLLGREPILEEEEADTALLSDSSLAAKLFGSTTTPMDQVAEWIANWVRSNKETLGKPTHFQVRDGKF